MSDTDHESKCIRHYTEWCWTRDLCIWHYTEWCWTCDLCIWHYTEWIHVGHVICVSDIIQNGFMLALWSCIWHYTEWCHVGLVIVYLTQGQHEAILYNVRYTDHMSNMDPFCIMSDTQITSPTSFCIMSDAQITSPSVSDIIQDDATLDSWSVYLTLYRMTQCWTRDLVASSCIMSDTQITSPTLRHPV